MKNYYVRKILNEDQLKIVRDILVKSEQNSFWQDGLYSGGGVRSVKNNLELSNAEYSKTINDMIMNSLDQDWEFIDYAVASETNLNIVSKTSSGGYYNPHIDNWSNGDYSTTVFLNNPDEYSGGELCLYFGGEDEVKIKLDAGWGVTYSTGTLHRVNKVISGNRYVSVFWTKSLISDPFIRFLFSELSSIEKNIQNMEDVFHFSNCFGSLKDPHFRLRNLKTEILRRYSK